MAQGYMIEALPLILPAETEGSFGPRMRALSSDYQRRFVLAHVLLARPNATEAARQAGYSGDRDSLAVTACRLMHTPAIIEAIEEEAHKRLDSNRLLAAHVLVEVASNAMEKGSARVKAAEAILNRTNMPAMSESRVTVTHTKSERDMIADIVNLAQKLKIDPKQLLGEYGIVLDAEFTEVLAIPAPTAVDELYPELADVL